MMRLGLAPTRRLLAPDSLEVDLLEVDSYQATRAIANHKPLSSAFFVKRLASNPHLRQDFVPSIGSRSRTDGRSTHLKML